MHAHRHPAPSLLLALILGVGCGFLTDDDLDARMDSDGDSYAAEQFGGQDCDDKNRDIWPGAVEVCDGIDNDCDGDIDGDALDKRTWYRDADEDGYGSPSTETPAVACFPPEGFVGDATDCNDDPNNDGASINPQTVWFKDKDDDGYGDPEDAIVTCIQLPGLVSNDQDCDDEDPDLHPNTVWWEDQDRDGHGTPDAETTACWIEEEVPDGFLRAGSTTPDCDDDNVAVYPGVAAFETDETLCTIDHDLDGFGAMAPANPNHESGTDCDDDNPAVYPNALELWYDQVLNDCLGELNTVSISVANEYMSGISAGDYLGKAVRGTGYFFHCDPSQTDCEDTGQRPGYAVAAPSEDTHGPSSGAVYLVDPDFDDDVRLTLLGSSQINRLGRYLIAAGDLNEDTHHDLLVGTQDDYAYVIFGAMDVTTDVVTLSPRHKTTALAVYVAEETGDDLGSSGSGLMNFSGDGNPDLALGAPMSASIGDGAGRVYIFPEAARSSTINLAEIRAGISTDVEDETDVLDEPEEEEFGDVEDTGRDDEGDTGSEVEEPVGAEEATWAEVWTIEPEADGAGALFGQSLADIGDFNGDGHHELVIGAPSGDWSETDAGRIYLLRSEDFNTDESDSGASGFTSFEEESAVGGFTKEISATDLVRVDGKFEGERAGQVVASAGDFNGDGLRDIVISATGVQSSPKPGRIYIWLGTTSIYEGGIPGAVLKIDEAAQVTIEPDIALGEANFGASVSTAGPLLGVPSIKTPGDLDGDGMADLLIGSPDADSPAYASGRVYLVYGGITGFWDIDDLMVQPGSESGTEGDGRTGFIRTGAMFYGDAAYSLGYAVDGPGDISGDGHPDLLLGAPGADLYEIGTGPGAAFILTGVDG